ncbi:YfiH family protein [Spongiibacter sp. IMCC21906]|uniref:peptidoglycan editing factor PgeF n=1 Tax=Spongiibacter sp. IMCC21906 TaxID=1620392 RepID=UPI00062DD155|nr:peptidoglycan editing factor PgeF [Spongiibacter sp. IMCC21906]AKH68981.1 YfiH family protein [Spongiibacter sp. IMCC21906]
MLLTPDWPAPDNIVALSTSRLAPEGCIGASAGVFAGFNLGDHVGDDADAVARNRQSLLDHCPNLSRIAWLEQVHGTAVVTVDEQDQHIARADAAITQRHGVACAVMTADCLPVLLCSRDGSEVAAAHAGWRGLCQGVLVRAVEAMNAAPTEIMAWVGPGISQRFFEVGAEVRTAFLEQFAELSHKEIERGFRESSQSSAHFYADLPGLAVAQLQALGLPWVDASQQCTYQQQDHYFSFRRDGRCGRQASLIYIRY